MCSVILNYFFHTFLPPLYYLGGFMLAILLNYNSIIITMYIFSTLQLLLSHARHCLCSITWADVSLINVLLCRTKLLYYGLICKSFIWVVKIVFAEEQSLNQCVLYQCIQILCWYSMTVTMLHAKVSWTALPTRKCIIWL